MYLLIFFVVICLYRTWFLLTIINQVCSSFPSMLKNKNVKGKRNNKGKLLKKIQIERENPLHNISRCLKADVAIGAKYQVNQVVPRLQPTFSPIRQSLGFSFFMIMGYQLCKVSTNSFFFQLGMRNRWFQLCSTEIID